VRRYTQQCCPCNLFSQTLLAHPLTSAHFCCCKRCRMTWFVSKKRSVHWLTHACSPLLKLFPGVDTHFAKHLSVIKLTSSLNTAFCCSTCVAGVQRDQSTRGAAKEKRCHTDADARRARVEQKQVPCVSQLHVARTCSTARNSGESSIDKQ
jgi:hypothetical protein